MKYNLLDLFSGIGGFHKGLHDAGFEFDRTCFSEIDKHAIAIYKNNFKEAEYVGGVESVRGDKLRKSESEQWIVTFGSPCQDLSIAGHRKGLAGNRSNLFFQAIRIIQELQPEFFIWENVKGAFSSNGGKDFVAVLREVANLRNYGCQWECVNSRWIIPQNRERIFLVGYFGNGSGREIFPVGEDDKVSQKKRSARNDGMFPCITATEYKGPSKQRYQNLVVGTWRTHKDGEGFREISEPICPTIPARAREDGSGQPVIKNSSRIRRLTPIECERLQMYPDNWTQYGNYDGKIKQVSDTQRYKTLGNSVTTGIVKLIGERLT